MHRSMTRVWASGWRLFFRAAAVLAAALVPICAPASGQNWVVRPEWAKAHEDFLASPALRGRGSATRDEAIAAAYVAAEFERFGLKIAPGMTGYTQVARVIRPRLAKPPSLTVGGSSVGSLKLLIGAGDVRGPVAVFRGADADQMPTSAIVVPAGTSRSMPSRAGTSFPG